VGPGGERLDQPVLGLYRLQGGKLVRGQMFYFDTTAVAQFLARAAAAAV
jgi:ketosteroid isomerase-like protein